MSGASEAKTLKEKFDNAKLMEGTVYITITDWVNALGKDVVTSVIYKNALFGASFNMQCFYGKIDTNIVASAYTSHIFEFLTKLCTIEEVEGKFVTSAKSENVKERVEKLIKYTKDSVAPEHIECISFFLLDSDLYFPVLEATSLELTQVENAKIGGPTPPGASETPTTSLVPESPSVSLSEGLERLEFEEERHEEEEEWEEATNRGEFGGVNNLSNNCESTLVSHEETGVLDFSVILPAQQYTAEVNNRAEANEGHEGDLGNENFLQILKLTRFDISNKERFKLEEVSTRSRTGSRVLFWNTNIWTSRTSQWTALHAPTNLVRKRR
ncbi:hypothetical protein CYMTET_6893 [Cymbomonas tetramitiformis]|uniref:Uncharacterized protein n=1 Tax=Cymbomonas tetramitiformis TaxID=36881 RepID=A0AAE0GWK0_9CHLO|nr:hypothetical protein CYMTET_6893 [Cymbomonas tetramitiformis]